MKREKQDFNIYSIIQRQWAGKKDKKLIISNNQEYSYREIDEKVKQISKILNQQKNCNKVCAIYSSNAVINIVLILACAKEEWMCLPLNHSQTNQQIVKQLKLINPSIIISSNSHNIISESYLKIYDQIEMQDMFITIGKSKAITDKLTLEDDSDKNIPFLITTTSGSTSDPKPIVFSHQTKFLRARSAIITWKLNEKDILINGSPFYHSLGQRHLFIALIVGATLCCCETFEPLEWLRIAKQYNVTFTIPVTTHLHELSKHEDFWGLISKDQFKAIISSSAALSLDLKKRLIEKSNNKFYEMYGASEVGTATIFKPSEKRNKLSVGNELHGVKIKIIDKNQVEVKQGDTGSIAIKSMFQFMGYISKERTIMNLTYKDKYFEPGDLGYLDKERFLYYRGRSRDSFVSGGINIYTIDIENAILEIEDVDDVIVTELNSKKFGSIPIAGIVSKTKMVNNIDLARKIRAHCARQLAPFQVPRHLTILDKLPKLANGKLDYKAAKKLVTDAISKPL